MKTEPERPGKLARCVALVTGASSGVGRAVAVEFARTGCEVCITGRNAATLAETAALAGTLATVHEIPVELTDEDSLQGLHRYFATEIGRLDWLIHCAGILRQERFQESGIEDFDAQYRTNVRAPYRLTQLLLPLLVSAAGQIVFINSSVALGPVRAEIGQYAATKQALRAVADSLREELNPQGVRVLSMYLGRTATPMQEAVCQHEGKTYRPDRLLQPHDIASLLVRLLTLPGSAEITEISVRPILKP